MEQRASAALEQRLFSVSLVTRRSGVSGAPADYVAGDFLTGHLAPGAPAAARYAQAVATALAAGIAGRGVAATARGAGLARSSVQDLLAGRGWPDLVTLAKLEDELDVTLWPGRDRVR